MKLLVLSLGLLLHLFFTCSCVACAVCLSSVIIHCEPTCIISLLVLRSRVQGLCLLQWHGHVCDWRSSIIHSRVLSS